jgi:signal transduction protein with GAF and PtsI domain
LLRSVVLRAETAVRLRSAIQTTLLRSIVGAAVALFEAEAASIALYRPNEDSLEFVIAAGPQGDGVVGLTIPSEEGIAGYVFTTGEPIAIADLARDARFTGNFAADTGYVPRSILAVPLRSAGRATGVLEVLDKSTGSFGLRDVELATVFADQAAVALEIGALALDSQTLLRTMLMQEERSSDSEAIEAMASEATRAQSGDDAFWAFVDAIVGLRIARPEDRALAVELLDLIQRRVAPRRRRNAITRLQR